MKGLCSIALVLVMIVVVLGAYVRLSDAGISCPDWPVCYDKIWPSLITPEAVKQYPERPFNEAKVWKEMVHRYVASAFGLVVLLMLVVVLRHRRHYSPDVVFTTVLLSFMVIFQALLGMWTVTTMLHPYIVVLHLLGGFVSMGMIWWIWLSIMGTTPPPVLNLLQERMKFLAIVGCILLLIQVGLGGWVSANYAALTCSDFPKCNTTWGLSIDVLSSIFKISDLDADIGYEFGVLDNRARASIHMLHRFGAGIVTLYWGLFLGFLIWHRNAASPLCKRIAGMFCVLLVVQLILGVLNVLLKLSLPTALGHNACAAILVLCGLMLWWHLRMGRGTGI